MIYVYTYIEILIEADIFIPMNMKIIMCQGKHIASKGSINMWSIMDLYGIVIWIVSHVLYPPPTYSMHACTYVFFIDYSQGYIHVQWKHICIMYKQLKEGICTHTHTKIHTSMHNTWIHTYIHTSTYIYMYMHIEADMYVIMKITWLVNVFLFS